MKKIKRAIISVSDKSNLKKILHNLKKFKIKLIKKKNFKSSNFEIRFHLEPNVKVMKTQDRKSILIDIGNEGWKFSAQGYTVDVETGLYFGKKNSFTENKNLFISGITQKEDQVIEWEFEKI